MHVRMRAAGLVSWCGGIQGSLGRQRTNWQKKDQQENPFLNDLTTYKRESKATSSKMGLKSTPTALC